MTGLLGVTLETEEGSGTSVVSKDSFTTASSRLGSSGALAPPQGIRKSVSVDSFVKYGIDPNTRQNRAHTTSGATVPIDVAIKWDNGYPSFRRTPRLLEQQHASVAPGDSNGDQEFPLDLHIHSAQPFLENGPSHVDTEGKLPVRTPSLSMTSTESSILSDTNSARAVPAAMQRRGTTGSTAILVSRNGRARSGSLRENGPEEIHPAKAPSAINTSISTYRAFTRPTTVTLLVAGAKGCGKSLAVKKGAKIYRLFKPECFSLPADSSHPFRYIRSVGELPISDDCVDYTLHILEVDAEMALQHLSTGGDLWPSSAPPLDGVLICYDSGLKASFEPVEQLLRGYQALLLPTVVMATKTDLDVAVSPQKAMNVLRKYDVGLVEVSALNDQGKMKLRASFEWLIKAVIRSRGTGQLLDGDYRNPASPEMLLASANTMPPWNSQPRSSTPTAASSIHTATQIQTSVSAAPVSQTKPPSSTRLSSAPTSPTRARSMSDLLSEHEKSKREQNTLVMTSVAAVSTGSLHGAVETLDHVDEIQEGIKEGNPKLPGPAQWATLDELLEKLLFLAVSGDDPAYVTHFLLTYRRFASPRSILLAMQKQLRQFDDPAGDPMFSCFAQMKICHLLELWIRDYPTDFAVQGTIEAYSALILAIMGKSYLLQYATDFVPFMEIIPTLHDKDSAWAIKPEELESEDAYTEEDGSIPLPPPSPPDVLTLDDSSSEHDLVKTLSNPSSSRIRDRKNSVPLAPKLSSTPSQTSVEKSPEEMRRNLLKELVRTSQELALVDSNAIAEEITRLGMEKFLAIQPRHWLQYTLSSVKKDAETDTIASFNALSNHFAGWVASLILCHDRAKQRAKQIEKFVDIALKLRQINNYSALRAFVAGINSATFPEDETMKIFRSKYPDAAKNFQSWDVLLQAIRSHRAYRLALRVTKGACIPALEVHMQDLIKAHEGNPDNNPLYAGKVHWGKSHMMGKFIMSTSQYQAHCRSSLEYNFQPRPHISKLLMEVGVMDSEMQTSRIAPPSDPDDHEHYRPPGSNLQLPRSHSKEHHSGTRDTIMRKLFVW